MSRCYIKGIEGMVNNVMSILDEGINKNVCYYYSMALPNKLKDMYLSLLEDYKANRDLPRDINMWFDKNFCDDIDRYDLSFWINFNYNSVCDMLGMIPFIPSLSINVSPAWKGMGSPLMHRYEILQDFAKSFIAEYVPFLFTEYAYVIENGSEGNFPHIHMVFQCNPKTKKQLNTWLAKNAKARITKHFKKICLMHSFECPKLNYQTCRINTEPILNDKIDYLFEDRKPPGHTNKPFEKAHLYFGKVWRSSNWNSKLAE